MQHKQNAILVRLSFRHPIPVAPFGENLSAPFKLGKDFIMTGVIIQTFGPVKPNLDLARGNDLCHRGRAPVRIITDGASKPDFRDKVPYGLKLLFLHLRRPVRKADAAGISSTLDFPQYGKTLLASQTV